MKETSNFCHSCRQTQGARRMSPQGPSLAFQVSPHWLSYRSDKSSPRCAGMRCRSLGVTYKVLPDVAPRVLATGHGHGSAHVPGLQRPAAWAPLFQPKAVPTKLPALAELIPRGGGQLALPSLLVVPTPAWKFPEGRCPSVVVSAFHAPVPEPRFAEGGRRGLITGVIPVPQMRHGSPEPYKESGR